MSGRAAASLLNRAWKVDAAGVVMLALLSMGGYVAGLGPYLGAQVDKARHDMAIDEARRARDEARAKCEQTARNVAIKVAESRDDEVELVDFSHRHLRVGEIARLAADTHLMVDQVTPGGPEAISGTAAVVKVPILLSGKGSYVQISEFLRELHAQHRDTEVGSVKVLAEPETNGALSSFSVQLFWFAKPDAQS